MTNARASWNVISTQSVYLYNCPLFEATRVEYPLSDEKTGLGARELPIAHFRTVIRETWSTQPPAASPVA